MHYYANFSTKLVKKNFRLHDPDSPLLIGNVKVSEVLGFNNIEYIINRD